MGTRRKGTDTRAEIQQVALALFTEGGYDATSMRQIAEHVGITKAALYYHFDSKESIVASLIDEYFHALDGLLEHTAAQPPSPERSANLLANWLALTAGRGLPIARFVMANQSALRSALPDLQRDTWARFDEAVRLILGPDAPLLDRLRVRVALLAVQVTVLAARGTDANDTDILTAGQHAAALLTADLLPVSTMPDV